MTFVGNENEPFETGLYIAFASIAGILFFIQIIYLQKLRMLPVYILPALSACICWENALLAGGSRSDPSWRISQFVTAIQALIIPFNVIIIFEMPFRLHQARTAHFLCIPFEQGEVISRFIAKVSLWSVRVFALGLLVITIIVNFKIPQAATNNAGNIGFVYFNEIHDEIHMWLALLPPLILSVEAVVLSIVMQRYLALILFLTRFRYAKDFSLGVRNQNYYWRYLLPISLIYAATQTFGRRLYPVLSNGGDVCLLIGESIMTYRVQLDLAVAGSFADFLHRSNVVFRSSQTTLPPSHTSSTTHHSHVHHHHPHPHHKQSQDKGDYSLVAVQQREISLNGGDIEMNSKPTMVSTKDTSESQPPEQQVLHRDQPENGNGQPSDDQNSPAEEGDVDLSFTNTYQSVEADEPIEVGENKERLAELPLDQRSKVGRLSLENIQEKV